MNQLEYDSLVTSVCRKGWSDEVELRLLDILRKEVKPLIKDIPEDQFAFFCTYCHIARVKEGSKVIRFEDGDTRVCKFCVQVTEYLRDKLPFVCNEEFQSKHGKECICEKLEGHETGHSGRLKE